MPVLAVVFINFLCFVKFVVEFLAAAFSEFMLYIHTFQLPDVFIEFGILYDCTVLFLKYLFCCFAVFCLE